MHYYNFNIGDYRKDTSHLIPIEHYIYRTLIDWYYLDENPIPKETQVVLRRLSLGIEHEKNLLNVLQDFFKLTEKGWEHGRIKIEINDYHEMVVKNKSNGKLGGRPKKTQSVPSGMPDESQNNPSVTLTNNQEPITNILDSSKDESLSEQSSDRVPYEQIRNIYHQKLPGLPKCKELNSKRRGQIRARWKAGQLPDLETWSKYFEFIGQSAWLTGKCEPTSGRKHFIADLEWITNETNYTKIIEGKYHG